MNRIHTAIFALVMSIFLIQAIDPPFEKSTGTFLHFFPVRNILQSTSQQQQQVSAAEAPADPQLSSKDNIASDRQDNFPYSLSTELKPPPTIETALKPPPPPKGLLLNNIIPDNVVQSSENRPTTKKNKPIVDAFRYLNSLGLDLPSLPIETVENIGNQASLYPPLDIDSYLNKLTPEQIEALNQKIPGGSNNQPVTFQQHFNSADTLSRLRDYLAKIKSEYQDNNEAASSDNFKTDEIGTSNEHLLGKDFIKPLLKLYENAIHHHQPDYVISNGNSSTLNGNFGGFDDEMRKFTQDELHLLIHDTEQNTAGNDLTPYNEALIVGEENNNGIHNQQYFSDFQKRLYNNENLVEGRTEISERNKEQQYQDNDIQRIDISNGDVSGRSENNFSVQIANEKNPLKIRRDDLTLSKALDNEHIGEILPTNFNKETSSNSLEAPPQYLQYLYGRRSYRMRKSFDPISQTGIRRVPFAFPRENYRPEYEATGVSADGSDLGEYQRANNLPGNEQLYPRAPRVGFFSNEINGIRVPRRYRGFRENYAEGFQPYFDNSARYQTAWSVRKPRVIFPTDIVAFKDSEQNGNQEAEQDWLSADNQLQDIQEQDTRDRG